MIKITGDFHTHTQFSHGKGTVELNAKAALESGILSLAYTDHGLGNLLGGLRNVEIADAKAKVELVRKKYPQLTIYFGIEANIMSQDGTIDIPPQHEATFEVVILGFHACVSSIDFNTLRTFVWRNFRQKHDKHLAQLIEMNTSAIIASMRRYRIDALAHLSINMPVDVYKVALVAAETDTCIEINNKHMSLSAEQLLLCQSAGTNFLINSDAHNPNNVGRPYEAIALAEQAGLNPERILNAGNNIYIPKRLRKS